MLRVRPITTAYGSCQAPCPQCGVLVLTGATVTGVLVALDTQVPCYVALWLSETPRPVLHASRGYPVHRCGAPVPQGEKQNRGSS